MLRASANRQDSDDPFQDDRAKTGRKHQQAGYRPANGSRAD